MRFRLNEALLNEGKNIERTWEQYKDKILPKLQQFAIAHGGDPSNELACKTLWKGAVLGADPTYDTHSDVTGDYGVWLTNMFANDKFTLVNSFIRYENLLNQFIQKKSNLEHKDINYYKSPKELEDVLKNTDFSERQKERQKRKSFEGAERVFNGEDWEVWVPETYEAACSLGAGSGWCTADTRTREHYNRYTGNGNLFIIINKHNPKEKYQFHFESEQFMGSGTNPGHTPDKEYSIDKKKFLDDNPELLQFFTSCGYMGMEVSVDKSLTELDIESITLLSVEEAKRIPLSIREFSRDWWLKTKGDSPIHSAIIRSDGMIYEDGINVYTEHNMCARPALVVSNLNSFRLPKYALVKLDNGTNWRVISDKMLLCAGLWFDDQWQFGSKFDEDSNDYDTSEIKQRIHNKARELGLL